MSLTREKLDAIVASISSVLIGKEAQVRVALACLLARGHLLIEDLPGMGKTTLANAMARVLGLEHNRIQFTSDLLPADIVGVSVYDRDQSAFQFHPGPVFCQLLLADEINRTTPKTQSALLEAMAEGQVTVEGETRDLPTPFFVIATQNPVQYSGTFPLPESQLDRFLMRLSLGYPDLSSEKAILTGGDPRVRLRELEPQLTIPELLALQDEVDDIDDLAEEVYVTVIHEVAHAAGLEGAPSAPSEGSSMLLAVDVGRGLVGSGRAVRRGARRRGCG